MKLNLPKEWFIRSADLEGDSEVGAGVPPGPCSSAPLDAARISEVVVHLAFGKFIALKRRKLGLSIEQLAHAAEADPDELRLIEGNPEHVPELSTVVGLAKVFRLPARELLKVSGLAEMKSMRVLEESVRFAADARPSGPLSPEEEHALAAYVATILQETHLVES